VPVSFFLCRPGRRPRRLVLHSAPGVVDILTLRVEGHEVKERPPFVFPLLFSADLGFVHLNLRVEIPFKNYGGRPLVFVSPESLPFFYVLSATSYCPAPIPFFRTFPRVGKRFAWSLVRRAGFCVSVKCSRLVFPPLLFVREERYISLLVLPTPRPVIFVCFSGTPSHFWLPEPGRRFSRE